MARRNESGEVVVEATIVVTIVMIFVAIMFYIGTMLYQQSLVSVMANQTASNIAQVYGNNLKDAFTGYVDPDNIYQTTTYSSMKTDAYIELVTKKANAFAKYRLKSSRLLSNGAPEVQVQLVKKEKELLKSQVVVSVSDSYDLPLVSMFGASNKLKFTATGRADCVDTMEYINGVQAVGDPENSNITALPFIDSCTITFIADRTSPSVYATVSVLTGKSIISSNRYTHSVMPVDPIRNPYRFAGWVDSFEHPFTATTEVNGNTVVYGKWDCLVTLDASGGRVNGQPTYSFYVPVGGRASFASASRDGYTFVGWFSGQNGSGKQYISNDTSIEGPITLYAYWKCTHENTATSKGWVFVGRHGTYCGQPCYDVYRCQRCGAEKQVPFNGQHDHAARCNGVNGQPHQNNHPNWTWHGTCGTHTWHGWWHAVCTGCRQIVADVPPIYVAGQWVDEWKYCGAHNWGRPVVNVH